MEGKLAQTIDWLKGGGKRDASGRSGCVRKECIEAHVYKELFVYRLMLRADAASLLLGSVFLFLFHLLFLR